MVFLIARIIVGSYVLLCHFLLFYCVVVVIMDNLEQK